MCSTCTVSLPSQEVGGFAKKMIDTLNGAALALMTSIGHRTGLFDAMAGLPPSTSSEIADKAGLQERYVREWLGAMVTGEIVEYDAKTGRYELPAEHAAYLTRAARPNNVASTAQWISVLGNVEDRIIDCFHRGGGVSYEEYARFHEVMADESDQTTVAGLFEAILPLAPELIEKLEQGIDVLDVGCGRGRALIHLAERFPRSRFTGLDLGHDAIRDANAHALARGLTNVQFEVSDVAEYKMPESFDLITAFDAIHDQADPARVLENISASLRRDGTFLMQDIAGSSEVQNNVDRPMAPFVYTISCMHCMTVSLARDGAGLGAAWGEELATTMLRDAGFTSIQSHQLEHDMLNTYFIVRHN